MRLNIRKLREKARREINGRMQAIKDGYFIPNDILSNILKTRPFQPNAQNDIESLVDEFITLLIAGS